MIQVSIVLGLHNSLTRLPKLFAALRKQKGIENAELLIMETSSTDGTAEYLQKITTILPFPMQIVNIKKEEFGHGKTRNKIIKYVKGETTVFISDDIEILSDTWLIDLTSPLSKGRIGAVFGQQIPYSESSCYDHFFYHVAYPDQNRTISGNDLKKFTASTIYYSMANACARTFLLKKFAFAENKDASVDQWWAKMVLEDGYLIYYSTKARIRHSHINNLRGLIKRQFLSGQSLRGLYQSSASETLQGGLQYVGQEIIYVKNNCSLLTLLTLPFYETLRIGSFFLGKQFINIPQLIKKL